MGQKSIHNTVCYARLDAIKFSQLPFSIFDFDRWLTVLVRLGAVISIKQKQRALKPPIPFPNILFDHISDLVFVFLFIVNLVWVKSSIILILFWIDKFRLVNDNDIVFLLVEIFIGEIWQNVDQRVEFLILLKIRPFFWFMQTKSRFLFDDCLFRANRNLGLFLEGYLFCLTSFVNYCPYIWLQDLFILMVWIFESLYMHVLQFWIFFA